MQSGGSIKAHEHRQLKSKTLDNDDACSQLVCIGLSLHVFRRSWLLVVRGNENSHERHCLTHESSCCLWQLMSLNGLRVFYCVFYMRVKHISLPPSAGTAGVA